MGMSNYFDELIVLYLSNELNAEEESFVLDWINSSEQNKVYFEELRSTWKLLAVKQAVNDIDIDNEWRELKQAIGKVQKEPSFTISGSVVTKVIDEVRPNRKLKLYRLFVLTAVAVSLLFVIALEWRLNNTKINPESISQSFVRDVKGQSSFLHIEVNTTGKIKQIVLKDGTVVKLFPGSRISYQQHSIDNKRYIWLTGKATFNVAKDKTKPFTVLSGDLATTALGTRFTITAFENQRNFSVRLYEGKVVIRSHGRVESTLWKTYYLLPGQELIYDNKNLTAITRPYSHKEAGSIKKDYYKTEIPASENLSVPNFGKGTWYMFNNQSLSQVFSQLEGMFGVDLIYSKKDFSNIYFIGTFNITDSLDTILKQIAGVNILKVIKKNSKIIITKH